MLTSKSGATFFASVDIRPVEKRVESMTRKELERAGEQDGQGQGGDITGRLKQIESKGQRMLDGRLKGLTLTLTSAPGAEKDAQVAALVEPNYYEWKVAVYRRGLKQIAQKVEKRGESGRYNEQLAFLEGLASEHKVSLRFEPGPKAGDFPEYIRAIFEDKGDTLEVWCYRFDLPETKECALSGRPLGSGEGKDKGTAKPHDALSASDWREAFKQAGRALGVDLGDAGFKRIAAFCTGTSGLAVGDGPSVKLFDEQVHVDKNAIERRRDTAGKASDDRHEVKFNQPSITKQIGRVKVSEYRGKDFDKLNEDEVIGAMRARAKIAAAFARVQIEGMFGPDAGFTRLIQGGALKTKERALQLVQEAEAWIIANKCK